MFDAIRLTVAPLDDGAVKAGLLTSFAAGIPRACSPAAAEGLDLPPDLHGIVAADDAAMAALVLRLHDDPDDNDQVSKRIVAFALDRLSEAGLDAAMARVVEPGRPSAAEAGDEARPLRASLGWPAVPSSPPPVVPGASKRLARLRAGLRRLPCSDR